MSEDTLNSLTEEQVASLQLMAFMYFIKERNYYFACNVVECLNQVEHHSIQIRRSAGHMMIRLMKPNEERKPLLPVEWAARMRVSVEDTKPVISVVCQMQDPNAQNVLAHKEFFWKLDEVIVDLLQNVDDNQVNMIFAVAAEESLKRSEKALLGDG